jgi:hypothetical protein
MSRNRNRKPAPGDIFHSQETGGLVRIGKRGEQVPFVPHPHEAFPKFEPDQPDRPRRADGTVAPFYPLTQDQLEQAGQETSRTHRTRHDGWTIERQKNFIERLAATASVTDAARYVGMSRQSARDLYNRSPQFRAAWDEAVKASVGVLAETAFDRAVNGVQEQVWYKGRMVGFREKHDNRLLMFLLRVRDPLNYAPLDDLQGWQRHRALEDRSAGLAPTLDRLEAAEQAWAQSETEPPALPAPSERLEMPLHVTSSESSSVPPEGSALPPASPRALLAGEENAGS